MLYLYSTSCLFLFFLIINFKVCNCYLSACEPVVRLNKEPVVKIANFASFTGSATISLKKKRIIFQYLGIPYAIPPVGYFRFKVSKMIFKNILCMMNVFLILLYYIGSCTFRTIEFKLYVRCEIL